VNAQPGPPAQAASPTPAATVNGPGTVVSGSAGPPPVKREPPWGAIVVITGLVAVVAIFTVAALHYKQAADVATATAGVSGVIAALVGAYFGVRGATLAQKQAEQPPSGNE
jgi:hypothetical protein